MKKTLYALALAAPLFLACEPKALPITERSPAARKDPAVPFVDISQLPENTLAVDFGMEDLAKELLKNFPGREGITLVAGAPSRVAISRRAAVAGLRAEKLIDEEYIIYVNERCPLEEISLADLRKVFAGEIPDWTYFGWENRPVRPVFLDPMYGAADALYRDFLGIDEPPAELVLGTPDFTTIAQLVGQISSCIGIYKKNIYHEYPGVREIALKDGKITLPLSLFTAEKLTPLERALVEFLKRPAALEILCNDQKFYSF